MALTPSGAISFGNINTALNRSATAAISMNDPQVRFLTNQSTGSVDMNATRNKYTTAGTITVGLYSSKPGDYYGFLTGLAGSLSVNDFYGRSLSELWTGPSGNTLIGISGDPPFPFIATGVTGRMTANGVVVTMEPESNYPMFWVSASGASALFTSSMSGNTYNVQFVQN
jgi:hypothetical protein